MAKGGGSTRTVSANNAVQAEQAAAQVLTQQV